MHANINRKNQVFMVEMPFSDQLVTAIKATGAARYCGNKLWRLLPTSNAIQFLIDYKIRLSEDDWQYVNSTFLPALETEEQLKVARKALARATTAPPIDYLQQQVTVPVFDYQYVPVHYAVANDKARFLLADEMGVGKSLQILLVTMHKKFKHHPVLIVCPANVIGNWQDEILKLTGLPSQVLTSTLTKLTPGIRYYICSYDQMKHQLVVGAKKNFSPSKLFDKGNFFIIFDECQLLKNRKTKRYKMAKQLSKNSTNKVFLTGTPCDKPIELYAPLSLLDDKFMSWTAFATKFCAMSWGRFGMYVSGAVNQAELNTMLDENFMIRRTKADVLPQLPEVLRQTIRISKEQLPAAKSVLQMFSENANFKVDSPDFRDWVEDTLEVSGKTLVFGHHQVTLDMAEDICKKKGWKYIRIDGSVSSIMRQSLVRQYQADPDIKVALLSLTAAGMGINLTEADTSIFLEMHWSQTVLMQAEGRNHRPGQKHNVLLLYPIFTDFEHYLQKLLFGKLSNIRRIIDGGIPDDVSESSILKQIAKEYNIPVK